MRIAVTGASGFIGGRIARSLAASGHQVFSFGRRPQELLADAVPNYESWDIVQGPRDLNHAQAIVHCAAHVGMWGSDATFEAANVRGTRHVVESAPSAARIVYVSSGSVHHERDATALPPYARTKLLGERIVHESGRQAVVLRPHIVYGPGDTTLWPRVLQARRGTRLFVPGDGRNRVSVTHVDNLVQMVTRALQPNAACGTFDIADAEVPTMGELLHTMFTRHTEQVRIVHVPRSIAAVAARMFEVGWRWAGRESDPPLTRFMVQSLADPFVLDISPARKQFGYAPQFTFRDGPL